jgi:hypothetical protein
LVDLEVGLGDVFPNHPRGVEVLCLAAKRREELWHKIRQLGRELIGQTPADGKYAAAEARVSDLVEACRRLYEFGKNLQHHKELFPDQAERQQCSDVSRMIELSASVREAVSRLQLLADAVGSGAVVQPDGTIKDSRIWLDGAPYRLTPGLQPLLSYLLHNPGCSEDAVIRHCAYSSSSHLHKRLKDLRDALKKDLKKARRTLHIKTEGTCIFCEWKERK